MKWLVRVESHRYGPRLFVLGRRLHEWHLGSLLLLVVGLSVASEALSLSWWTGGLFAVGVWMLAKDARDILPHTRDTGTWRVGIHVRFAPLRAIRYADGLPSLAGAVAFAIGVVNLASAVTPNVRWRGHLLLQLVPLREVPLFHAFAVPASLGLIVTATYLRRRRQRALHVAIALLLALGVLDVLKGLDVEEALLSWAGAALLWWGRSAFVVRPGKLSRRAILLLAGVTSIAVALTAELVWVAAGGTGTPDEIAKQTLDLFTWREGAIGFRDEMGHVPLLVGLVTVLVIIAGGAILFRTPREPVELPDDAERDAALELVRSHGSDTLAFFKLRRDLHYLFADCGRAFLGYRVENEVLIVAGDPIGDPDAIRELVTKTVDVAESRGLAIAVLSASEELVRVWRDARLRALYIGDEAIVETKCFSLEGRAIRKVRQAVTRSEREGFTAEAHRLGQLDPATLAELERVSHAWRDGAPERGFSMALDAIGGGEQDDSVIVLARDGAGSVRAFLHYVPSYGRPAMSLSFMRREHGLPNGVTEFLVVRSIELLRERGVEELSLNFAAFGRFLERPSGAVERALGRMMTLGDRYFQIESLYKFNAKFAPRWEPRYLVFETLRTLPRVGLAAMAVEGQRPKVRT
jgi:lysyl-tRNA synthetase, class II